MPVKVTLTVKHIANNHILINMFSDLKIMQLHAFFHIHDSDFETPLSIFAMPCVLLSDDVMLAHI